MPQPPPPVQPVPGFVQRMIRGGQGMAQGALSRIAPPVAIGAAAIDTAGRTVDRMDAGEAPRGAFANTLQENLLRPLQGLGDEDGPLQEAVEAWSPPPGPPPGERLPVQNQAARIAGYSWIESSQPPAETPVSEPRQGTYSDPLDTSPAGPFMTVNPQDPGEQVTFGGATPFFTHGSRDLGDGQLPSNKFETVYTDAQGNPVATFTGPSQRQGTGGFVGAATDAEAARSRAAKRVQDQNASEEVARINRQIDSMRGLRADQMGVSRDMLARLEGRSDEDIRQTMPVQDQYQSLVAEARDPRNSPQQRMQYAFAAEQLQPQLEQQAALQERQMQEQGLDRRAEANRLTQLAVTELAQVGRIGAERMKGDAAAQKRAEERRTEAHMEQAQLLKEQGAEDVTEFYKWLHTTGPSVLGQMKYTNEQWAKFLAQPTSQETLKWYSLYKSRPQPGWFGTGATPQQHADRFMGN